VWVVTRRFHWLAGLAPGWLSSKDGRQADLIPGASCMRIDPRHHSTLLAVVAVTATYAAIRYNVFKGVGWEHFPLFVMNKSIAWSGTILLLLAGWQAVASRVDLVTSRYFIQAAALGGLHVLVSLVLLGPARYPDLFDRSMQLNLVGELALLGGVVATGCLVWVRSSMASAILLPLAVAAHCAILGFRNWITPGAWPGRMPPITLLSAMAAVAALVLTAVWSRRHPRAGRQGDSARQ